MRVFICRNSNGKQDLCISVDENYALFKNKTKLNHPTPIRMATIVFKKRKKTQQKIKSVGEGVEKLETAHVLVGR